MSPRLARMLDLLDENRFQGVVLNAGPSLEYLFGVPFHLMERPVLAFISASGAAAMALPELEASRLVHARTEVTPFTYGEEPATWAAAVAEAAEATGLTSGRLATDSRWMRLLELDFVRAGVPDVAVQAAHSLFDKLRVIKDEEELSHMRTAVQIAERGLLATIPSIRVGITEKEIAAILVENLLREGSDTAFPFSPIVAAGPNAADPHAVPTERRVVEGDVVLVDWGASHDGYYSDLTRVFCVGEPSAELQRAADVVLEANLAATAAGRPGVPAGDVDQAARGVIEGAGLGDFFIHRTGHGLGREVHEAPYIRADNDDVLQVGMTFTIEPGVYFDERFGVRIEDDVVVTSEGVEALSSMDRRLLALEA